MQAAAASASQVQVQQLTAEVQQLKAYYDNLHHQLQQAQQLKSAAESQIEAWRAQHAQQAPRVAELLSERQAWIEELQRERAAASAAAAAAEVSDFHQTLCPVCRCNDLSACISSQRLAGLHSKIILNAVPNHVCPLHTMLSSYKQTLASATIDGMPAFSCCILTGNQCCQPCMEGLQCPEIHFDLTHVAHTGNGATAVASRGSDQGARGRAEGGEGEGG